MEQQFKILSITIGESGYLGDRGLVAEVRVEVDAKYWAKLKSKQSLGQLYGIDISNEVGRLSNRLFSAWNPTVGDSERASKGMKTIKLRYHNVSVEAGELAGLEIFRLKSGEAIVKSYSSATIYDHKNPKVFKPETQLSLRIAK